MNNNFAARIIVGFIDFAFGLAIIGLIIRLLLRLFGANPHAKFSEFIYNSTAPLLDPFKGVFTPYVIEKGSVLELSTVIAIGVYLLIAWLIAEFVAYISYNASNTYRK